MEPIDIWRAAQQMVKRHGDLAPTECRIRAEEMADKGDKIGSNVWRSIGRAAKALLENGPPTDIINA